ncbi:hypothetical protein Kpol_1023p59 [Vanderwaltozyma polyspora DSM 70294]|uniref:serine--tRNA ligase n=1 Tax=Vanderwaltozyma polyspora (strain ATCC 22028 / DSM 70294 / BCRC 21397 / CBS 2163 / NBRC 10782 / NRRL Y-8283 / UCD 57-17) TaxID=436907 RepID=A7TFT2_VANPO|nr:uncharacterized protein Kpol_1023p59 [Vanderwaltozyma polyspora DSM 70294]EDO18890.1 hypothetical protein Kpol_1023p59 [Vanderwaltozyma polyspora DSM 70294]
MKLFNLEHTLVSVLTRDILIIYLLSIYEIDVITSTMRRLFSTSIAKLSISKASFNVRSIISNVSLYQDSIKSRKLTNELELLNSLNSLSSNYNRCNELSNSISLVQVNRKKIENLIKSDKNNLNSYLDQLKSLKTNFTEYSNQLKLLKSSIDDFCSSLPNLIHETTPISNPQIVHWINPKDNYTNDPDRDHVKIMVDKGLIDFKTASAISGNSWYYLLGRGAQLEHALVSFAIEQAMANGFELCFPPTIARNEVIDACGFRPRDMNNEQQIYHIEDMQSGLIATAEITLAGLGINKVLDLTKGPKKLVGVSRSFRAEAGARGRDTKGLYRVHEFTKVELFCWAKPADSERLLEDLKNFQVDLVTSLGLSAKLLNMPANDLGAPAYKKYDIEAWMPGRGSFGEITSTSNCTDFQSRRMNTKYKNDTTNSLEYVHTLNGTAMAIPRIILAIVENFYNPDTNLIEVPKVLQKYMGGISQI